MKRTKLPISMASLRELYRNGENILRHLREAQSVETDTVDAVLVAYDPQAGAYVRLMQDEKVAADTIDFAGAIARVLDALGARSFLEAGVGEATTLAHVIRSLSGKPEFAGGFDISWSRVAFGRAYLDRFDLERHLTVGDLFAIPFADNAVDVVYTSHSIEPNRGRRKRL